MTLPKHLDRIIKASEPDPSVVFERRCQTVSGERESYAWRATDELRSHADFVLAYGQREAVYEFGRQALSLGYVLVLDPNAEGPDLEAPAAAES